MSNSLDIHSREASVAGLSARHSSSSISLIAIFAVLNSVMIQLIMSSRILYGIAREG